jgi:hypothetical protein
MCSQTGTELKKISSLGNVNSYPYSHIDINKLVVSSVADPHHCADPNPDFHFDADPDPTFHFDADPAFYADPDTHLVYLF